MYPLMKVSKIQPFHTVSKRRNTMKKLMELVTREDGVTAPEYALIAALIAVVIIGAVTLLGEAVERTFNTIAGEMP
jgi:pilus assembly protein Flp/PilA